MDTNPKLIILLFSLVALIIVYYSPWKKKRLKISFKSLSYLGYVFMIVAFFYFTHILLYSLISFGYEKKTFVSNTWKSDPEKRYEMIEDLFNKRLIDNKPKLNINLFLGTPFESNDSTYNYYVGFIPKPFATDPYFLVIKFKEEKVNSYLIKPFG